MLVMSHFTDADEAPHPAAAAVQAEITQWAGTVTVQVNADVLARIQVN
jgi:hypothetical protein